MTRNTWWLVGAMVLAACGPAGTLTGKVTVEGGSAGGIAVIVYGPQSAATVTAEDGSFSVGSLPDGKYVVKATLRGADVEEQAAAASLVQGKTTEEPSLNFKLSTAKITGKVVFADGASAQDLTVTAVGAETRGARTSADGSFTFENLKTGAYVVSVEAIDTKEGRVSIGVNASGTASAGELHLTPVGRIGGSVSFGGMAASGVSVMVPGTSLVAVSDATGRFSLEGVPTGAQALLARVGTAPFFRSATAMVTIVRGANPDAMLALTDDPPPTGTVTGLVTFRGPRSPRDISITAPGSGVTVNAAVNGAFSMTLPVGVWDIVASAPAHPAKTLGRVLVNAGQLQTLPGQELSWWRPLWTSSTNITSVRANSSSETNNWGFVVLSDAASNDRLALLNAQTFDFRLLWSGTVPVSPVNVTRISRNAKYAGWYIGHVVFVYEIGTGLMSSFDVPGSAVTSFEFSSDESTLFIARAGPFLTRIPLATPTMATRFPTTGNATAVVMSTVDRWLLQETTDVALITPTTSVPQVFTQVSLLSVTPTPWALTNCAGTCQLRLLAANSTTAVLDSAASGITLGGLTNFAPLGLGQTAEYPCFRQGVSPYTAFCVSAADGTHIALVAQPTSFRLNEGGTRVIFTFTSGPNTAVREETFPPQMSTTNLDANTVGWNVGWLSPTRAFAFEASGTPRKLHLVRNGTDVVDADVGSQTITNTGGLLVFPRASTNTWHAVLTDGMVRSLNVATSVSLTGAAGRLGSPVAKYGAASFSPDTTIVIDENAGALKLLPVGQVGGGGARIGTAELVLIMRSTGSPAYLTLHNAALFEINDVNMALTATGNTTNLALLSRTVDLRTLVVGSFAP